MRARNPSADSFVHKLYRFIHTSSGRIHSAVADVHNKYGASSQPSSAIQVRSCQMST